MSKFVHDDETDDEDEVVGATTLPRRFLRKQANYR